MNITQIEENIKQLTTDFQANKVDKEQFVYDFLLAYGHRKSSVSRVKSGERNLSKVAGEVRWKRHIYFKYVEGDNLRLEADKLKNDKVITRDRIRFVVVTDFNKFLAIDIKTGDSLDIKFDEILKHFDFFLPWAGMEKAVYQGESPADVKAAEKMATLFDLIKADNFNEDNKNDTEALHNLNVFLTRLLFCFFAEDTEIFTANQFSHALESHTNPDGSGVADYLNRLFNVLNTSNANRGELPDYLDKFPFVNGGLFAKKLPAPVFSTKSREMLIECGKELDWSDINPDIFGSMIQAVVHPDKRGSMGMHYTSVTNIMKVLEPLFLDALYAELENIEDNIDSKVKPSRLRKLKERLTEIKIFDPACGSGNFLIIAFKELRKFEMDVIRRLQEIEAEQENNKKQDDLFAEHSFFSSLSEIKLSQFYGIEIDDFAHEVAILSLWLAEHQMNVEFKAEFGLSTATLPLNHSGNIYSGSALQFDWESVCSISLKNELFIVGNPPYLGSNQQSKNQKQELLECFNEAKGVKNLDYVSCWLYKASLLINKNKQVKAAFVTTNSITQGEQVPILWPKIYSLNVEIDFAYRSFKWANNAKHKAAVTCVIIGLRAISSNSKFLISSTHKATVANINPYLIVYSNLIVEKRRSPLSKITPMLFGSKLVDGGNLILSNEQKISLVESFPESTKYLKNLVGADEYVKGNIRWCLWIKDTDLQSAVCIPDIKERIELVRVFRNKSTKAATRNSSNTPHLFGEIRFSESNSIIVPRLGSERREYILAGFLGGDSVILDRAQAIPDATLLDFALITSKMHMKWASVVCGRFKTDINYSSSLCYNTFPVPNIQLNEKENIEKAAMRILEVRESYPDKSISYLYDPVKMPDELREAHKRLDLHVDNLYSKEILINEDDRLNILFTMYEEMAGGQNA